MADERDTQKQPKRVRTLKAMVQPVFVIDDGEELQEVQPQRPIELKAGGIQHAHQKVEAMRAQIERQVREVPSIAPVEGEPEAIVGVPTAELGRDEIQEPDDPDGDIAVND